MRSAADVIEDLVSHIEEDGTYTLMSPNRGDDWYEGCAGCQAHHNEPHKKDCSLIALLAEAREVVAAERRRNHDNNREEEAETMGG